MIRWSEPNITLLDIDYVKATLDGNWFSMGKQVALLEEKMIDISNRKYTLAINNGTSALTVALRSLGIGIGDEVIVPALSYIASATAISLVGAKPVFVDVGNNMTIETNKIKKAVTEKTKAILSVDFGGNPCNHTEIFNVALDNNLWIINDGAQSIGATHKNKPCLSYGDVSTTSFHIGKQITTVEGGMIFSDKSEIAEKCKIIRNQGEGKTKYLHEMLGGNYRMNDVLASLAIKQLEVYDIMMKARYARINKYKEFLREHIDFMGEKGQGNFSFIILSKKRDKIAKHLKKNNIETRCYIKTIPQQPIYNVKESFPKAEWFVKNMLLLPLHNKLSFADIKFICDKIKEVE